MPLLFASVYCLPADTGMSHMHLLLQVMQQISDHVRQQCLTAMVPEAQTSWPLYPSHAQRFGHTATVAARTLPIFGHQPSMFPDAARQQAWLHPHSGQFAMAAAQPAQELYLPAQQMYLPGQTLSSAQHQHFAHQQAPVQQQQTQEAAFLPAVSLWPGQHSSGNADPHQHEGTPPCHSSDRLRAAANSPLLPANSPRPTAETPQSSSVPVWSMPASGQSLHHISEQRDLMHTLAASMPDSSDNCIHSRGRLSPAGGLPGAEHASPQLQQQTPLPLLSPAVTDPITARLSIVPISVPPHVPASVHAPPIGLSLVGHCGLPGPQQRQPDKGATFSPGSAEAPASEQALPHRLHTSLQQQQQQQQSLLPDLSPRHELQAGQALPNVAAVVVQACEHAADNQSSGSAGLQARLPGFSALLQSVEHGQPAVGSAADGSTAVPTPDRAAEQSAEQQHPPLMPATAPAVFYQGLQLPSLPIPPVNGIQSSSSAGQPLPLVLPSGCSVSAAAQASTYPAQSVQPAVCDSEDCCMQQPPGAHVVPDFGKGVAASVPRVSGTLGSSPEVTLSEGSFRFQAGMHSEGGFQSAVLCTPVLRPRSDEEPSVAGGCCLLSHVKLAAICTDAKACRAFAAQPMTQILCIIAVHLLMVAATTFVTDTQHLL